MTVYVYDKMAGRMVPKAELLARRSNQPPPRNPDLAAPRISSDTMAPVQSMLDGRMYDSKAALRQTYSDAGVTEVGDDSSILDPKPFKPPEPDRKAIRESLAAAYSKINLTSNEAPGVANPTP